MRFLVFAPTQRIGALVINSCPIAFIHLAIGLQRAVVDFVISLNMEHADKAAPFELHDAPRLTDLHFADRMQALALRIHCAVTLQARQPHPAARANQFQVLKAGVLAIKDYAGRRTASLVRLFEQRLEVVVLRQRVPLLVEDAIVAGDVAVAVRPQHSNQVDAAHDRGGACPTSGAPPTPSCARKACPRSSHL